MSIGREWWREEDQRGRRIFSAFLCAKGYLGHGRYHDFLTFDGANFSPFIEFVRVYKYSVVLVYLEFIFCSTFPLRWT